MPDPIEVKEAQRERSRQAKRQAAEAKRAAVVALFGKAFLEWASLDADGLSAFRGLSITPNPTDGNFRIGLKVWSDDSEALVTFGSGSTFGEAIAQIPDILRQGRFMPDKFAQGSQQKGTQFHVHIPEEDG